VGLVERAGSAEREGRRLSVDGASAQRTPASELRRGETSAGTPPRWSQGYQTLLVLEDLTAGLEDANVSGIALWQLTDIKADDDANRVRARMNHAARRGRGCWGRAPSALILLPAAPVGTRCRAIAIEPPLSAGVRLVRLQQTVQREHSDGLRLHQPRMLAARRREPQGGSGLLAAQ
jgi:hypothetical protein